MLFHWKRKLRNTGWLEGGRTDIHCHLLPGVDDGAADLAETATLLKAMQQMGVQRLFLTPHISEVWPANTPAALTARFEALVRQLSSSIELHLAGEYMLDGSFRRQLSEGVLSLPGQRLLVETSYWAPPMELEELLYEIQLAGYQPLIAHPERYRYMEEAQYRRLKNNGCLFQLNLFSLAGLYGRNPVQKAARLLELGLYDYIGSDCHHLDQYQIGWKILKTDRVTRQRLEQLKRNNSIL